MEAGTLRRHKEKKMRLDKFLKVSRLIKRRTVANEACDAGRVMVNGKPAKASVNVKVGDIIEIGFGPKTVKVACWICRIRRKRKKPRICLNMYHNMKNLPYTF